MLSCWFLTSTRHGGKRTVHMTHPYVFLRPEAGSSWLHDCMTICIVCAASQAVQTLMTKEAVLPQGELLCTRVLLEDEKKMANSKKQVVQLPLGGICFKKAEDTTVKLEKSTDDCLLVQSGTQPKHCSHLLK